jgi:hypothetical protein
MNKKDQEIYFSAANTFLVPVQLIVTPAAFSLVSPEARICFLYIYALRADFPDFFQSW